MQRMLWLRSREHRFQHLLSLDWCFGSWGEEARRIVACTFEIGLLQLARELFVLLLLPLLLPLLLLLLLLFLLFLL
jgi:hypothetical protein